MNSGTFTVPEGVTQITVEAWGGGSAGERDQGNGGGGGAYAKKQITVEPGETYNVVVGSGGTGGNTPGNGENSIFGSGLVIAAGAQGQSGGSALNSIGDVVWSGGNGGPTGGNSGGGGGGSAFNSADGNPGGSGGGQTGGIGGTGTGNGGDGGDGNNGLGGQGNVPGGGGGGGGNKTSSGADGAPGQIVISWCSLPVITVQPVSATVTYDSDATFTVETNDTNISFYQWQVNTGSGWSNTGTNNNVLTVSKPEVNISGFLYRCILTNDCGTYSISNEATLTVNPKVLSVAAGAQNVTYGTHDGSITENGTYTISGFANGDNSSVVNGLNTISFTTNYTETTNAGSSGIYITPVINGLSADNYSFAAVNGTITIDKADQYISCDCVPFSRPLNEFDTIYIGAVASSGLPVTITMETGSAAILHGSPGNYYLTDVGSTGSVTLFANQAGNENFNPAPQGTRYFDVTKSNQNISFPAISDRTYFTGLTVELEAVASSGLEVSYIVESGPATISGNTLTITGTGVIYVRAVQVGDASYNAAASVAHSFTVNKGPQTITISVPSGTLTESTPITASSTSGLPVSLALGTGSAASGLIDQGSYYTLTGIGSSGYIYIVGNQAGDANFLQADQVIQTIDLSKSNQSITFNPIVNQIYAPGLTVPLSASASSGLAVSFSVISGPASLSANTLTISGAGTVVIEATQSGNASYNPAPTVTQQFEVLKATPVIVQNDISKLFSDPDFMILPTSESSGSFSFISGNDEVFTISGNIASITGAGTTVLNITQQPTANYNGAIKSVPFRVTKYASTIAVTGPTSYIFNDAHQGPDTSIVTGSTGAVTYSYIGTGTTVYGPSSVKPMDAGTYSVTATVEEDDNYESATSNPYAFTIAKADAVITIAPYSVTYDGVEHSSNGTAEGVASENLSGLDLSGTGHTAAGTYIDSWTFTDETGNYNDASGTVTNVIVPKALTIQATDQSKCFGEEFVFNGDEFSSNGLVPTETIDTINLSSTGTGSSAVSGDYSITPSNAGGGTFDPSNYSIDYNVGTLKVFALPTLTGASQGVVNCEGSVTTINLTGLLPDKIFSLEYTIDGTPQTQKTGLYSDSSGNSSFTTSVLTKENNDQILQITGITITSEITNCSQSFAEDVVLKVTPNPTATGATQIETVCEGDGAEIRLTGLVAGSTFTAYYTIDEIDQPPVEGLTADASGNAVFNTAALTAINNGQTLRITDLEITDNLSGCIQPFALDVTLSVDSASVGGTAVATDVSICENENSILQLTGYNGSIQWQQSNDGLNGWNNVNGGSGETSDTYITPPLTSTKFYRAIVTSGVCNYTTSSVVEVTVNPLPATGEIIPD